MTPNRPTPLWLTVWTRVLWPLLAVSVAGAGLLGSVRAVGALTILVSSCALAFVTWATVLAVAVDRPGPDRLGQNPPGQDPLGLRRRAPRIGIATACVVVVMSGWTALSSNAGATLPLAVIACSPPVLRLLVERRRGRTRRQPVRPAMPARVFLDREMVDQRFAELVKSLEES